MPRFRNIGGAHSTPDGTTIAHGTEFESDDAELQKKFPNKFEKVSARGLSTEAEPVVAQAAPALPEPIAQGTEEDTGPAAGAEDVTAEFPAAVKNDLTVVKDSNGYWLLDDGDPVNPKGVRTKAAVTKAITEYLK